MPHPIHPAGAPMPSLAQQQVGSAATPETPFPRSPPAGLVPARVRNAMGPDQLQDVPGGWERAHFKMASGMQLNAADMAALPCAITAAFPVPQERDLMLNAVVYGQVATVQEMLWNGVSATHPDSQGFTALVAAATQQDPALLQAMIAADVDVNAAQPRDGTTPLIAAAAAAKHDNVATLIAAGADISLATKDGTTALDVSTSPAIRMMLTLWANQRAEGS